MKCPRCGMELGEKARRCSGCGVRINKDQTEGKGISSDIYSHIILISVFLFAIMLAVAFFMNKKVSCIYAGIAFLLAVSGYFLKKKSMVLWMERLFIPCMILSVFLIIPYVNSFSIVETDAPVFNWDDVILNNYIPEPASDRGNILTNSEKSLEIHVYKTSPAKFRKYVKMCEKQGFRTDAIKETDKYIAYNESGYNIKIAYDSAFRKMEIRLNTPIELENMNWDSMDVFEVIPKPESSRGKIDVNIETEFSVYVGNTTYDDFRKYVTFCENKGFSGDGQQDDKSFSGVNSDKYRLKIEYLGGNLMYIHVEIPRYTVSINFKCEENLFFSKYDVDVFLKDEKLLTVAHGSEDRAELSLKKGEYKLKFQSCKDRELSAEKTISIIGDSEFVCNIKCTMFGPEISISDK